MRAHPVEGAQDRRAADGLAGLVGPDHRRAPRAVRRNGLPVRPVGGRHLGRRPAGVGGRRLRHDDGRALVQAAHGDAGGARGAGAVRRKAVRPGHGAGVPVHLGAPAGVGVGPGLVPAAPAVLLAASARRRAGAGGGRPGRGRRGRGRGRRGDDGRPARRPSRQHAATSPHGAGTTVAHVSTPAPVSGRRAGAAAERCAGPPGRPAVRRDARAGSRPEPGQRAAAARRAAEASSEGSRRSCRCSFPACRSRFRRTCRRSRCRPRRSCRCRCRRSRR